MKVFSFFLRKVFFRNFIVPIVLTILIIFMSIVLFYGVFAISQYNSGINDISVFNNENNYIGSEYMTPDEVTNNLFENNFNGFQESFNYLHKNYEYLFCFPVHTTYSDNQPEFFYINENYLNYKDFSLSKWEIFNFNYNIEDEIPILIGPALQNKYRLGESYNEFIPAL